MDYVPLPANYQSNVPRASPQVRRDPAIILSELKVVRWELAKSSYIPDYLRQSAKQLLSSFAQLLSINTDLIFTHPESSPEQTHLSETEPADAFHPDGPPESVPSAQWASPAVPLSVATTMASQIAFAFLLFIIGTAPDTIAGLRTVVIAEGIVLLAANVLTWHLQQSRNRSALVERETLLRMEHSLTLIATMVEQDFQRLESSTTATPCPVEPSDSTTDFIPQAKDPAQPPKPANKSQAVSKATRRTKQALRQPDAK